MSRSDSDAPWLETWYEDGFDPVWDHYPNRKKLAMAAPQLVRALLAVEWEDWADDGDGDRPFCPSCGAPRNGEHAHYQKDGVWIFPEPLPAFTHNSDCQLDTALTAAGLIDQASRDAARREMK